MNEKKPRKLSAVEQAANEVRRREELIRTAFGGADVQRVLEMARLADSLELKMMQQREREQATIERLLGGHDVGLVADILKWYGEIAPLQETQDVFELVDNLAGDTPNLDHAAEWLDEKKDDLTSETLSKIVYIAMLYGVSNYMRKVGEKRHAEKGESVSRIPALWEEYKAKKLSKGNAAPRIADELGLAESTVRKKLQGL